MDSLRQDLQYGLRTMGKSPGFTAIAVLTLALGIGANTAIFSVVNAVLLRPLPYDHSEQLVFLSEWSQQVPYMSISMANFNDWREMNSVFESLVAYRTENVILTGQGEAERVQLRQVTAGLFPTLRIQPLLGRPLTPDDDKVGAERVVLLGEDFWQRRFGGDPNVVGKNLILDGESYTIVGVMAAKSLHSTWRRYDLYASLWRLEDRLGGPGHRGSHPGIYAYARLKPGVSLEQTRADLGRISKRLEEQYPDTNTGNSIFVQGLLAAIVEDARPVLLVLMAAVGFVLLIACANVANLLLARATERQKEIAVRAALGAGRWRLVRQLLTESVMLAVVGGALGMLLAVWGVDALVSAAPSNVPRLQDVSLDRWVLLFSLGITLFTGLFFGIFPALQVSRTDLHDTLKEGGRGGSPGTGRRRLRNVLVVAEVAVSLVLLVSAGLMIKSLYRVLAADPGFDPRGVLVANVSIPEVKYDNEAKRRLFIQQVVERMQAVPGVEFAGFKLPLLGNWQTSFIIEGRPIPEPGKTPSTDIGRITPDSLRVMGIRLLKGRYFTEHDNENSEQVCIIDENMANAHWPGEDPIGKRLSLDGRPAPGEEPEWLTVVGVVAHVKHYGVDQPSRVETYVPIAQNPAFGGSLILRTSADPSSLASGVRAAVAAVDPDVPIFSVRKLEEIADERVATRRLSVMLLGAFAVLAMVLAAVGLYGVMSYWVTQRRHEIGIRMVLGAQQHDVFRLVLANGLGLMALGVALGLGGAFYLSRFLQTLLFQVTAHDLITFVSIPALLAAVGLLACYLPARRATRVDPMVALRYE